MRASIMDGAPSQTYQHHETCIISNFHHTMILSLRAWQIIWPKSFLGVHNSLLGVDNSDMLSLIPNDHELWEERLSILRKAINFWLLWKIFEGAHVCGLFVSRDLTFVHLGEEWNSRRNPKTKIYSGFRYLWKHVIETGLGRSAFFCTRSIVRIDDTKQRNFYPTFWWATKSGDLRFHRSNPNIQKCVL
jgi:hypothetical protein